MNRLRQFLRKFAVSTEGVVLTEALLVIPVVTILAIGILEFGSLFWQRQQMETGVRDAARYWSRCRPDFGPCSIATARNLAFYGSPGGGGALRVPNWYQEADLTIEPATPPVNPGPTDLVVVTGTLDYQGSPLSALLGLNLITVSYVNEQRYQGW